MKAMILNMCSQLHVRKQVLLLIFYACICTLVFISTGAVIGYSAVTLPVLTSNTSSITLNAMEIPFFVSIINISDIIGSIVGLIIMNYGRRSTMMICGIIFSLGWILIASSYNVIQLFVGRSLTGIACGIAIPSFIVYLAEISIVSWRTVVTIIPIVAANFGLLIVYLLGFVIQDNWRLIAAFFIIPSILFVLCNIFFIHESPGWLLLKGRKEEAKTALLHIRGLHHETIEFQKEFAELIKYIELRNNLEISWNCQIDTSTSKKTGQWSFHLNAWSMLKSIRRTFLLPEVWKPFVILNVYFFLQKFSGAYVILFYTVDIVSAVNIIIDPYFVTVIVGIIQLVGNVICMCCSSRIGRRPISIVSGVGMSIFLTALSVYLQFFENTDVATVPLVCILFYVAFAAFGFNSIPWSMIPEVYPTQYVSGIGQLTSLSSILYGYAVLQLYPIIVTQNRNALIYSYCITSIVATLFVTIALPETRGKTKTQIEEEFRGTLPIECRNI
ncbi:PREDICTED: facilitated trehalose transporter Tret1-like [Wasmannia auropunctata]|uniref:facilitated trehalose transporter Tret1-like n=1 Tax=Wasmannia auropunctata TaxID=64793 RepID=UPI0005F028AE|nr:PREDICTED: facilitated trehalose transporter Tret1-like [Wasmannia auropunctata]